jgi:glycolate oxidase
MKQLEEALVQALGAANVRRDGQTLDAYSEDESGSTAHRPDVVVFAKSTSDVAATLKLCQELRVPVSPCGARSGKSGGSIPVHGGVAVSLERMNRIKAISQEDMTAVVEPGVITGELMRAVEAVRMFYPPDPNSLEFCTIGGNIAENAAGPRALKYGATREYVLGMEWVLPSGEVLRVGRKTHRGVAGYDLVGLLVGSEGTLGIATEITLQLLPLPSVVRTALLLFGSVEQAVVTVNAVLGSGLLPRALELFDDVATETVDGHGVSFPKDTRAAVLVEVDGSSDAQLLAELERVVEIASKDALRDSWVAQSESERERLWSVRRSLSSALRAVCEEKISEDIAVPRSRILEAIRGFKEIGRALGVRVATYGHIGDGNLHTNVLFDKLQRAAAEETVARILRLTIDLGGTITAEHGVGICKREFLAWEQAAPLLDVQRKIKALLDPLGLMNPGKIFPLS